MSVWLSLGLSVKTTVITLITFTMYVFLLLPLCLSNVSTWLSTCLLVSQNYPKSWNKMVILIYRNPAILLVLFLSPISPSGSNLQRNIPERNSPSRETFPLPDFPNLKTHSFFTAFGGVASGRETFGGFSPFALELRHEMEMAPLGQPHYTLFYVSPVTEVFISSAPGSAER